MVPSHVGLEDEKKVWECSRGQLTAVATARRLQVHVHGMIDAGERTRPRKKQLSGREGEIILPPGHSKGRRRNGDLWDSCGFVDQTHVGFVAAVETAHCMPPP